MRPIDADKLKERICRVCEKEEYCKDRETVCSIFAEIDEQPTIETKLVKYGHWIGAGNIDMRCSECGNTPDCEPGSSPEPSDYCPYCGAKMDVIK